MKPCVTLLASILAGLLLSACAERGAIEPVQTFYQQHAPHTDRRGRTLAAYDAQRSFLPLVLYHALAGEHHGVTYGLDEIAAAGFNAVHAWEPQAPAAFAERARDAGLQVVIHWPDEDSVIALADSPALLAWYLDEEPSFLYPAGETDRRFAAFEEDRDRIRRHDARAPIVVIDGPPTRKNLARWKRWNAAGDISSHFNYPVTAKELRGAGPVERVAASASVARRLVAGKKPLWVVLQAFGGEKRGWLIPRAATLRAMAYAAITHGATGIVYFAFDSFVTRDDGILGIAPAPRADYGVSVDYNDDGKPPLAVSDAALAASRTLYRAVSDLNLELATLREAILSPTSDIDYAVRPTDAGGRTNAVRALLKPLGDSHVLFAVNVDREDAEVRFRFPRAVSGVVPLFGTPAPHAVGEEGWTDRFAPESVKIYRVGFAP